MEVKGITWVGNVYQKFEAMCLEVEEIMYQDTVKYVENQVQNVGKSVKKFYSDVVQDLLPPSSFDPVKVSFTDLSVEHYSDVGVYKRPKAGIKRDSMRVSVEQSTEVSKGTYVMNKALGCSQSLHEDNGEDHLFPPSSEDSVKGTCSELHPSVRNNLNIGIKKIPENDKPPLAEMSRTVGPVNDVDRASSFGEILSENHGACDNAVATTAPALGEVRSFDSIAENSNRVENASGHISYFSMDSTLSDSASSEMNFWMNTNEQEGIHMRLPCADGLSVESNGICGNNGAVSKRGSSLDSDVQCNEISDKEDFVSHPERSDYWSFDAMEGSASFEMGLETTQKFPNVKLEETCVLVDKELHFVPQNECKHKPYKKKIREAFSLRMGSARKQEYEQLAVWYDGKTNQAPGQSSMPTLPVVDRKKSTTSDFCETEWELL